MSKVDVAKVLMLAVVIGGVTGCAMFNDTEAHYSRTTTVGQELIDLQKAKDVGAISEEDYLEAKQSILHGGPITMEMDEDD